MTVSAVGSGFRSVGGQVLASAGIFLFLAFTVWWVSFQVESLLEQNWGEQPWDVGCALETLCPLCCCLHPAAAE